MVNYDVGDIGWNCNYTANNNDLHTSLMLIQNSKLFFYILPNGNKSVYLHQNNNNNNNNKTNLGIIAVSTNIPHVIIYHLNVYIALLGAFLYPSYLAVDSNNAVIGP